MLGIALSPVRRVPFGAQNVIPGKHSHKYVRSCFIQVSLSEDEHIYKCMRAYVVWC